jgi:membrane protein
MFARLYRRDRDSAGSVVSSAVAFRLFLFFVPLLLLLVGVAGFASGVVSSHDVNTSAGVSGGLAVEVRAAFHQSGTTRWVATLVGLVGMLTAGRSFSRALWAASATAWRMPAVSRASLRVVGVVAGLLCGIGLVAALVNRVREELGLGVASVSFLGAFVVYFVGWMVVSSLLPRTTADPASLLPGSLLVAFTLTAMQAASQLYLPGRFSRASELYGAFGTTIVTLGWFFILGRAIVIAMTLNAVVYERLGSIATFVFSLPGIRALPRRSTRLREFFGLDQTP